MVRGTVSHIEIAVSLPACDFTIGGSVPVAYSDSAHTLTLLPAGAKMLLSKVSGCANLFHNRDAAAYAASYAVNPAQAITTP